MKNNDSTEAVSYGRVCSRIAQRSRETSENHRRTVRHKVRKLIDDLLETKHRERDHGLSQRAILVRANCFRNAQQLVCACTTAVKTTTKTTRSEWMSELSELLTPSQ